MATLHQSSVSCLKAEWGWHSDFVGADAAAETDRHARQSLTLQTAIGYSKWTDHRYGHLIAQRTLRLVASALRLAPHRLNKSDASLNVQTVQATTFCFTRASPEGWQVMPEVVH